MKAQCQENAGNNAQGLEHSQGKLPGLGTLQKVGFIGTACIFMLVGLVCFLAGHWKGNDVLVFMGLWFPLGLVHLLVVLIMLRRISRAQKEKAISRMQ